MNRREMLRLSAATALAGGAGAPHALADGPEQTPDEMIHQYLAAEVERLSPGFLGGAKTRPEWERLRPRLKGEFLDMLGLDPLPEKTDLRAAVTGTSGGGDVIIENLHFQSRPGLYVTGNLYRPRAKGGGVQKLPAVLYVCGHSGRGRDGNKTAFQDHGHWFAANGYVCLVVDTLQLGEVAGKHHGTYNLNRWWWHSRGYTPAGVECWNGIRAIDYLLTRPEVDPERLGVTGISGGGATTVWVAAADDRVKVAVPVSGMSDLESYVTNKVINGHCDCMFAYNPYRWEWTTILALFAPKPLLFANSDNDTIFPMDGNRRIIARLRDCYKLLGAPGNVDEFVSKGGHAYREDLRVAIFRFMNKHLKGDAGPVKDAEDPKIAGKLLRAFPEDKDLPKDQINDRADEVFVPVADVKLPAKPEDFSAWKAALVKRLRERCFRALPERVAGELVGQRVEGRMKFQSEPGITVPVFEARSADGEKKPWATLIVLNPDEDSHEVALFWARRHPDDVLTQAIAPRGCGSGRWTRKNPPNTVERSFALLGQTADGGRVRDVIAYATTAAGDVRAGRFRLRVVGRGQAGVIAAYAALIADPRLVSEVVIADPPASHRDGPHFLGVLRVLDIPDALGLLAPDVKLTLVNARGRAFDKTAAIYKLAGAEGKFRRG